MKFFQLQNSQSENKIYKIIHASRQDWKERPFMTCFVLKKHVPRASPPWDFQILQQGSFTNRLSWKITLTFRTTQNPFNMVLVYTRVVFICFLDNWKYFFVKEWSRLMFRHGKIIFPFVDNSTDFFQKWIYILNLKSFHVRKVVDVIFWAQFNAKTVQIIIFIWLWCIRNRLLSTAVPVLEMFCFDVYR